MIGQKQYEITDHLGNVLSTVSDQHLGRDINGDSVIDYYNAVIPAAYDYYPFGMLMPFRYTQDNSTHCATITTDKLYPVWVHHNIILNNGTTPIANSYGSGVATVLTGGTGINIYSPMITSGATISVPLQQKLAYNMDLNIQSISGSYSAQVLDSDSTVLGAITIAESGNFSLSYSAPTSSPVTLVFKAQSTGSNISVLAAGYWVFTHQSKMVTMTICDQNDNYRFGFNGKLKDNEWAGLGNSLDYGFRMEDTRIGRFRSVDPLTRKYPWYSAYQFSGDKPNWATDLDGKEEDWGWISKIRDAVNPIIKVVSAINVMSNMVEKTVDFTRSNEVTPYAHLEARFTLGSRAALDIKKFGGIDLNAASVSIAKAYLEFNFKTNKWCGRIDYLGKDGKVTFTEGASFDAPILQSMGIPVGAGCAINAEQKIGKGKINSKVSTDAGMGVGPFSVKGEYEVEKSEEGQKTTVTGAAGMSGAIGIIGVVDYKIEAGVKVEPKSND